MLLKEFFNYGDNNQLVNDRRYDAQRDASVLDRSDTRKVQLTLRQLNQLRMQSEAHELEKQSELSLVRQMYGTPAEAAPAE